MWTATRRLLEEAVPLVRGVRRMQVFAFAAEEDPDNPDGPPKRERYPAYTASTAAELPGYIEFILETTGGINAEWVLEMGWSITDESLGDPAVSPDGENAEGAQDGSDGGARPRSSSPMTRAEWGTAHEFLPSRSRSIRRRSRHRSRHPR